MEKQQETVLNTIGDHEYHQKVEKKEEIENFLSTIDDHEEKKEEIEKEREEQQKVEKKEELENVLSTIDDQVEKKEEIENFLSTIDDQVEKKEELENMLSTIDDCVEQFEVSRERTIEKLLEIQNKMDNLTSDVRKSQVAGTSATVIGGTMAAVGFIGSFFTFGLSSPLILLGGSLAAAGGVTNAGANLVDYFKNKTLFTQAQEEMTKLTEAFNNLSTNLTKLDKIAPDLIRDLENNEFLKALKGGPSLVKNGVKIAKHINFVQFISKMQNRSSELGMVGGSTAKTLFQNVSVLGSPLFQIGMGALGIIMVPVDIFSLVTTSIDLQNGKPSDVSKCVQEMIDQILKL